MTQPKRPIEVVPGSGARWTGWQKPIDRLFVETRMAIQGIVDRLKFSTAPSLKTAYRVNRVFQPEKRAFLLDTRQNGTSNLVNYVMRDGNTYELPFQFTGEGVFVAKYMKVAIKQRLYIPAFGQAVQMAAGYNGRFPGNVAGAWTTKFSIFPRQPGGPGASGGQVPPQVNFWWSMRDNTGWQLSDNLQSHVMLQPNTIALIIPASEQDRWLPVLDGGLYQFDTPWAFERDGQCVFTFRPTTPVLQFDSSIAGNAAAVGMAFDDRESGVRNQAVTVTVALHGQRYLTDQDAMRAGALTRIRRGEPG